MWSQTEHSLIGVEKCQARALYTDSHFEGLFYHLSLLSWPSPLPQDVFVPIPRPVLVVFLLA